MRFNLCQHHLETPYAFGSEEPLCRASCLYRMSLPSDNDLWVEMDLPNWGGKAFPRPLTCPLHVDSGRCQGQARAFIDVLHSNSELILVAAAMLLLCAFIVTTPKHSTTKGKRHKSRVIVALRRTVMYVQLLTVVFVLIQKLYSRWKSRPLSYVFMTRDCLKWLRTKNRIMCLS